MAIQVSRELPIPIVVQLQGQIEYGITDGSYPVGTRLPSIRELATELGLSPVTVAQAYKALQTKQLIHTIRGRGTFVSAPTKHQAGTRTAATAVHAAISQVIERARDHGLTGKEVLELVQARLGELGSPRPSRLLLVGILKEATRLYASELSGFLPSHVTLTHTTFSALRSQGPSDERKLLEADILITFKHRVSELLEFVTHGKRVVGLAFIPSEKTRRALAELHPDTKVGLVAFEDFLVTLRIGVERFAPHLANISAAVHGTAGVGDLVNTCDVLIYATGARPPVRHMSEATRLIEYKHVPDPASIRSELLPLLEQHAEIPDPSAQTMARGIQR